MSPMDSRIHPVYSMSQWCDGSRAKHPLFLAQPPSTSLSTIACVRLAQSRRNSHGGMAGPGSLVRHTSTWTEEDKGFHIGRRGWIGCFQVDGCASHWWETIGVGIDASDVCLVCLRRAHVFVLIARIGNAPHHVMDERRSHYQDTLERLDRLYRESKTHGLERDGPPTDVVEEPTTTTDGQDEERKEKEAFCNGSWFVKAMDGAIRGFVTAYALREGVGGITRAIQGLRRRRKGETIQRNHASPLPSRDALEAGFFVGGFTGTYHAIKGILVQKGIKQETASFAAGTVAGTSVLFLDQDKRRTMALYLMARVAQSGYNSLKAKGKWHFWGNKWKHGDTLLFSVASAQVMYAYVIRPGTLPPSYLAFIERISPIARSVIGGVRDCCRSRPINTEALKSYCLKHGREFPLVGSSPRAIPCAIMHPKNESCLFHNQAVFLKAFRSTFPLYLSLSTVPVLVFNTNAFMRKPLKSVSRSLLNAVQSTAFLSTFVSIYMGAVCLHRKLDLPDHKLNYFVVGLLSGCSLLVEKKSRRSELALYVMPRAIDALFLSMVDRRYLPSIPHGEVALFSICMGSLMYYYDHERDTVAPFVHALIRRVVYGQDPLLKVPSVAKLLPQEEEDERNNE